LFSLNFRFQPSGLPLVARAPLFQQFRSQGLFSSCFLRFPLLRFLPGFLFGFGLFLGFFQGFFGFFFGLLFRLFALATAATAAGIVVVVVFA
jgi:hypothetical protein